MSSALSYLLTKPDKITSMIVEHPVVRFHVSDKDASGVSAYFETNKSDYAKITKRKHILKNLVEYVSDHKVIVDLSKSKKLQKLDIPVECFTAKLVPIINKTGYTYLYTGKGRENLVEGFQQIFPKKDIDFDWDDIIIRPM
jgi:hypothetical protein